MVYGEVKRTDLLRALRVLGGQLRHQGGEVLVWFPGTTIVVGRRNFSRSMLCRVTRQLSNAGITRRDLENALNA